MCWGVTAGSALAQAAQLEALAARLADRSKRLLHGAAAYRQGLCAMSEGCAALAERLHEFCGGADDTNEEFMSVGALWEGFCAYSCPCAAHRCQVLQCSLDPRAESMQWSKDSEHGAYFSFLRSHVSDILRPGCAECAHVELSCFHML